MVMGMQLNRRQFTLGSAGLLGSLGLMAEASAQSASDYKALVCIFCTVQTTTTTH